MTDIPYGDCFTVGSRSYCISVLSCSAYGLFVGLAKTVYTYAMIDRIFEEIPTKNTVYAPYIHMVLANPSCSHF